MNDPVAYEWADLIFCPSCALRSTGLGMLVAGLPIPQDMDEAIATIALVQIERGLNIETPVALRETECPECQACGTSLQAQEEVVE